VENTTNFKVKLNRCYENNLKIISHNIYIFNIMMQVSLNIIYSLGNSVSSTNKTDPHDITDILLKVALNTINHQYHIICMENIYDINSIVTLFFL
jgi:hypothetical protein